MKLNVLLAPPELDSLQSADLTQTACVVIDALRATSTMVTALAHGARAILPAADLSEALDLHRRHPDALLAGERGGVRIPESLTGGVRFDLGNSPREFNEAAVFRKTIIMTTTNGTRALRSCGAAQIVAVGSFLNLGATVRFLRQAAPKEVLLVCSGTGDHAAYEDILCAGALCETLERGADETDACLLARKLYAFEQDNLTAALAVSRNGQRLLGLPELRDDIAFCAQIDSQDFAVRMDDSGKVVRCE